MKLRKKNNFKNDKQNDRGQFRLIFKIRELGHETRINLIEGKTKITKQNPQSIKYQWMKLKKINK
jgi:hypothetical protein